MRRQSRWSLAVVTVAAVLTGCGWTQVGGGSGHTGEATATITATEVPTLGIAWSRPTRTEATSRLEPVSDGTSIFVVDAEPPGCPSCTESGFGFVTAVDPNTGETRWRTERPDANASANLAVGGGLVVAGGDVCLIAYAVDTGAERWRHCPSIENPPSFFGPTTIVDGMVYEVTRGSLNQLRLSDGVATGRTFELSNLPLNPPPAVADGNVVAFHRVSSATTGATLLSHVPDRAALRDGVIFGTSESGGELEARSLSTGQLLWTAPVTCFGPPTVDATSVYVQGCGRIRSYDRLTGQERWHTTQYTYGSGDTRITIGKGLLYFTDPDSTLWILDATSGELVRGITLGTPPAVGTATGPPIVLGARVIVATEAELIAYEPT